MKKMNRLQLLGRKTVTLKRKRQIRRHGKNVRKQKRVPGQSYINTDGEQVTAKSPQESDCLECRYHCFSTFSEESVNIFVLNIGL